MNQVKIVEQAVLSVDEKYLKERYPEKTYIPYGLVYGDKLTERYKQRIRRSCGYGYPGGEIGAVIDQSSFHTFGKGYVFTEQGFYATKNYLATVGDFSKEELRSFRYAEIASVETVKKRDRHDYIRICTADEEFTGFANIYAPYLCEVLKRILHDLWGKPIRSTPYQEEKQKKTKKKEARTTKPVEPTPAPKPQEAQAKPAPITVTIDDLWEEATAAGIQPTKPGPAQPAPDTRQAKEVEKKAPEKKSSTVQASKKDIPSVEQPKKQAVTFEEKPQAPKSIATKLTYKSQIRMISDGSADHKAAALCQWLQNAANPKLFQIPNFTSTDEAHRALLESPVIDHLLIYTNVVQFQPGKLRNQLAGLKLAKSAKIFVCLVSFDDEEVDELIERDITELFDEVELSENKLFFVRCLEANQEESYRNFLYTLQWECLDHYRHTLPFRMPVDRVFHLKTKDSQTIEVVGGQVLQGSIQAGEKVCLVDADGAPQGTVSRILDPWKKEVDIALPGMNVDLLLTDIPREAVISGKIAAKKNDGIEIGDQFSGNIYAYKKAEGGGLTPLYEGMRCSVTIGSAQSPAVITLIHTNDNMLLPGTFGYIEFQTVIPLPMETGMAFRVHRDEKCIAAGHIYHI